MLWGNLNSSAVHPQHGVRGCRKSCKSVLDTQTTPWLFLGQESTTRASFAIQDTKTSQHTRLMPIKCSCTNIHMPKPYRMTFNYFWTTVSLHQHRYSKLFCFHFLQKFFFRCVLHKRYYFKATFIWKSGLQCYKDI